MYEEEVLTCEECGAKLTGSEGMTICFFCQENPDEEMLDIEEVVL